MAEEKKAKKTSETKAAEKKSKEKKKSKNPFKAIGSFFKSVRSEGKKIVWPKAKEVWKNTLVVLVVIIILGLIIYGIDRALSAGLQGIKKLAENTTVATDTADTAGDFLDDLVSDTDTDTETETEPETETDTTEAVSDEADTTEAAE